MKRLRCLEDPTAMTIMKTLQWLLAIQVLCTKKLDRGSKKESTFRLPRPFLKIFLESSVQTISISTVKVADHLQYLKFIFLVRLGLLYFIKLLMPKQVIINMGDRYPFGQCAEGDDQTVRVLVRKQMEWGLQPETLIERAQFFRRLNQSCIIRLEQILEQQEGMHLLYEYVPIRMQTWISNINEKFIESFCRQLI